MANHQQIVEKECLRFVSDSHICCGVQLVYQLFFRVLAWPVGGKEHKWDVMRDGGYC